MTMDKRQSKLNPMFHGDLQAAGHVLAFGDVTHVMGVINVSPESKNAHTVARTPDAALALARRYRAWGADLVDVGGQSSHYDNPTLAAQEEIDRILPVIEALACDGFVVAVDTWKPEVAEAALDAGAAVVNDTGGFRSEEMRKVVDAAGAAVIAVHVEGDDPHAVAEIEVTDGKAERIAAGFAELLGELNEDSRRRVIVDPGIAINYRGDYAAYTQLQLDVIRNSAAFACLDRPLCIPIPRKQDISWVAAYITMALEYGADLIRVHDVEIATNLTRLWQRQTSR